MMTQQESESLAMTALDCAATTNEALLDIAASKHPMRRLKSARLEKILRESLELLKTIPVD
jgi:hypothetical protein